MGSHNTNENNKIEKQKKKLTKKKKQLKYKLNK